MLKTTVTTYEKRVNNMAAEFAVQDNQLIGDAIVVLVGGRGEGLTRAEFFVSRAEFFDLCAVMQTVLETIKELPHVTTN